MTTPVFRFAPSPNGRLHLGHAHSACLNADLAARMGGRILLRIEDLDPVRSRPDLIAAIEADLIWLGLRFERPVLHQSSRLDVYRDAIASLAERGFAYPCFCSRATMSAAVETLEARTGRPWPRDPDGVPHYPGSCRDLTNAEIAVRRGAGALPLWRLHGERARAAAPGPHRWTTFDAFGDTGCRIAEPHRWGDVVIGRRDVPASYHLAVVIDDDAQAVTHVVRGADLLAATDIHVLLQALLGLDRPRYHHHALVRDGKGDKLAKSKGSESLADLRAAGWTACDVRAQVGFG
ncbi:glutamyl-Q tRNA(Asp) ligase [Methylobacterium sp. Leaf399]|uniref:tRNA glutamyl-Q(34) synthetase GluQRS n=1 Tax=unclassified Methylobacterium TaxID=2615210 RepID=UPI0006FA7C76|nr:MULTISPECIES: tRNA glutamyl-Q(34) synthetase GluQRS [unclassified Methylobacterium]KQT12568.1 glutamyl-Q tRNA(Asp) ligase [Methylobacterium sp. Leaf399]KQT86596.1 glutamyl-Q tRNA(Asp) ligase [Methylobacterium sp. Leaf466]